MTLRIPGKNKIWSQLNLGDIFGILLRSVALDLRTNPGKLRLAPRTTLITKDDDATIASMGLPIAFASVNALTFAVTGIGAQGAVGSGKVLVNTGLDFSAFLNQGGSYTADEPTKVSAAKSDALIWRGDLYVSTVGGPGPTNDIAKLTALSPAWNSDWYTTTAAGSYQTNDVATGNMFEGVTGNLMILDNDWISYVDAAAGTAVRPNSGTANTTNGTISFNKRFYPIWGMKNSRSNWIALMTWEAAITTSGKGYMAQWDGSGTGTTLQRYDIDAPCALAGCIHEDTPYLLDAYGILKKFNGTGFKEVARLPVANMNVVMPGVTNVLTNQRWVHPRGMEVVNGKINIVVNNFVSAGVYVTDMPSGVWEFDPNRPEQGLYHKGAPCVASTDWGQQLLEGVGAIYPRKTSLGNMLLGFSYYTDSGATNHKGIFYDNVAATTNRRGSFVTTWLDSAKITDTFGKVWYRFREFVSGTKVIGKFRMSKNVHMPFVASVSWLNTTAFTSTDSNFQYASRGDEVEVAQGVSASTTAHILTITPTETGYMVELADTIGGASGTSSKVIVDNFKWFGQIDRLNASSGEIGINQADTNVQIKTEIRDAGFFELDDMSINNATKQDID